MAIDESRSPFGFKLVLGRIEDPERLSPTFQQRTLNVPGYVDVGARISATAATDRTA